MSKTGQYVIEQMEKGLIRENESGLDGEQQYEEYQKQLATDKAYTEWLDQLEAEDEQS